MCGKWVLSGGLALYSMIAVAGSMGGGVVPAAIGIPDTCTSIISLSGGPVIYQNDQRRTIVVEPTGLPGIVNQYVDDPLTRVLGSAELFFGLGRPLFEQVYGQLGLALAYSGEGMINGTIYQNSLGLTNQLTYNYKVTNFRVGFKGKLIADLGYRISPYISAGFGAGFNQSSHYLVNGPNLGLLPVPQFDSNTELAFSYTAGFGVQLPITPSWQVGFGYEFDDWGKNSLNVGNINKFSTAPSLDTGPVVFLNKTYKRSNFFAHQIQFTLTYMV